MNKNLNQEEFFETSVRIAKTYGFNSALETLTTNKSNKVKIKNSNTLSERMTDNTNMSNILRKYLENSFDKENKPVFTYFSTIDKETSPIVTQSKQSRKGVFTLATIGLEDPFVEALSVSCSKRILEELDSERELKIRINSVGDRSSSDRYLREFRDAFRGKIDSIPRECVKKFHEDPLDAHRYIQTKDSCSDIKGAMPSTLKYLSDPSRRHFKSVLEYLDGHEINYYLAQDLIEPSNTCTHTIFEIIDDTGNVLASGRRCDSLSKYLFRRNLPAVFVSLNMNINVMGNYIPQSKRRKMPKVFFIHSCYQSRIKALPILDILVKEKVLVDHRLYLNKVTEQVNEGKASKFPFVLIVGHQEVLEGVARVRDNRTQAQEVIPLNKLPFYLKRLKNLH